MSGIEVNGWRAMLRPASLLVAAGLAIGAMAAHADNTFLLQLGTFDTQAEATQKWDDVKAKNSDIIGTLSSHIAEVALPPGNNTSYRTQVGPVSSREQANSLCNTLQSRGVQCYVVETAMFTSESPSEQPQEEMKETAKPAESVTAAPAHTADRVMAQADTSHSDDPDYIPPPVDSGPVIISTSEAPAPATPPVVSPAEIAQVPPPTVAATVVEASSAAPAEEEAAPRPVTHPSSGRYVSGREPHYLNQPAAAETRVASAEPPPAAASPQPNPQPESRGFFSRLFGSSDDVKPEQTQNVVGSVNVSEAVRVPLSTDNQPPKRQIVPVLPQVHGIGGYPSDSTAKTYWAQISYFRDETQALNFYRQFSDSYPQFSDGVRIRITRPFASSSAGRVSLRVGPFMGTDDVRTICSAANQWHARCTVVRDIGASAAVGGGMPTRSAHGSHGEEQQSHGLYWAQLGTYRFSQDAWDAWSELKSTHRRILGHAQATVTAPTQSSAVDPLFRLRAGPYTSQNVANKLCSRLQAAGAGCIVATDR